MATPYHDLLADVALRVNALFGPVATTLETTYTVRPLTATLFVSSIYPFSAVISALIIAEEKLAAALASTSNPVLRAPLTEQTDPLSSGDNLPTVSANDNPIIGVLGSVRDGVDNTACKEKTLEEIERRVRNAGSFYRLPMYAYKFDGTRIEHTRETVVIDCCVYNRATQLAAVVANSNMLLPDDFGEALVCGAVAVLVRDDEDMGQAAVYATYFANTLERVAKGLFPVPSKVTPGPTMTATAN